MSEAKIDWQEKISQVVEDPGAALKVLQDYFRAYNETVSFGALRQEVWAAQDRVRNARISLPEFVLGAEPVRLRGEAFTTASFEELEKIKLKALGELVPDVHRAQTLEKLTDPRSFGKYERDRFPHFARYLLVMGEQIPGPVFAVAYMTGFEMYAATQVKDFATRAKINEGPLTQLPAFATALRDANSPMSTIYARYKTLIGPTS